MVDGRVRPGRATAPLGRLLLRGLLFGGLLLGGLLMASSIATACGERDGGGDAGGPVALRVLAAASLTDVMVDLEATYEAAHPDVDMVVDLAGSATLRTQILEGAPADAVATADTEIMDDLAEAGALDGPARPFATNRLVIAVAPGNPAGIEDLADLTDPDRFVGLCATEVPCGHLADAALTATGLTIEADSREPDVRSLLTKIRTGELDAGLVYATDVTAAAADGVEGVDLPDGLPTTTSYPVAVLAGAAEPEAAEDLVALLTGAAGRTILVEYGFGTP